MQSRWILRRSYLVDRFYSPSSALRQQLVSSTNICGGLANCRSHETYAHPFRPSLVLFFQGVAYMTLRGLQWLGSSMWPSSKCTCITASPSRCPRLSVQSRRSSSSSSRRALEQYVVDGGVILTAPAPSDSPKIAMRVPIRPQEYAPSRSSLNAGLLRLDTHRAQYADLVLSPSRQLAGASDT